jgi:hypothetical protein
MGDDQETPTEAAEESVAEEAPAEAAADSGELDLETRVGHLEAAILALGGADRVPTL